jgi:hypothetical protein
MSEDSAVRRGRSDSKRIAATTTRWRRPLLEAVRIGAEQSEMPMAAFIRLAVKKELRRIGVPIGR